jgi:primosomal protein N' (replication factor Y)
MPFPEQKEAAYVEVALPLPVRKNFTYELPESFGRLVKPGARLLVPFGKRTLTGYAVGFPRRLSGSLEMDPASVKEVLELVDQEPLISEVILWLTKWAADYYLASWGEMLKASLPAGINTSVEQIASATSKGHLELSRNAGKPALKWKLLARVSAEDEIAVADLARELGETGTKRALRELAAAGLITTRVRMSDAPVKVRRRKSVKLLALPNGGKPLSEPQQKVIDTLSAHAGEMLFSDLLEQADVGASPINTLARRGLLEIGVQEVLRDPLAAAELPEIADITLNADQTSVFAEISEALEGDQFRTFVLHGVTGSGKTEVYIRAMRHALSLGKGAMMLVPEIALTPIFSRRLRRVFGDAVAILHSNLSPGERFDEWRRIRSGAAQVVIGTRSAVFAPIDELGLIIIDEEHDTSYRQSESPFYNARDLAVIRANKHRGVVVLGSATPSLESFHNAQNGKYGYLRLKNRIGGRPMATAELVDMRGVFKRAGRDVVVSPQLLAAIDETHSRGEQSIVLLNRRGFSSFVMCRSCGESLRCINCDITLTYHKRDGRIVCHYCNYSAPVPRECPFCESEFLYFIGQGTEQLEDILVKSYPDLRISRIDRDTMKRKGEIDRKLLSFDRGEIDMLVGTQMLAKGHDFHNVTLVGVISVDIGLGLPDFRAAERTFQLLTQVAGRAGRGDLPGRVLIQTYHPEHYALTYAVQQDYERFYEHEIRFREKMGYPPFMALALILIRHPELSRAEHYSKILRTSLDEENKNGDCRILGPAAASIARLKGDYRIQIILKSTSRKALKALLSAALERAEVSGCDTKALSVEIDPVNMM